VGEPDPSDGIEDRVEFNPLFLDELIVLPRFLFESRSSIRLCKLLLSFFIKLLSVFLNDEALVFINYSKVCSFLYPIFSGDISFA
jgi:hypothetical protein